MINEMHCDQLQMVLINYKSKIDKIDVYFSNSKNNNDSSSTLNGKYRKTMMLTTVLSVK